MYKHGLFLVETNVECSLGTLGNQIIFPCDLFFTLNAWISCLDDVSVLLDAFIYGVVIAYC